MNWRVTTMVVVGLLALQPVRAQKSSVSEFFDTFAAEWIRGNPDQAVATRYLTGAEQQRLERQLTPQTAAWTRGRRALARRGLVELARFDRGAMSDTERLSAELMQWQLQTFVNGEQYDDYAFPFEQFGGANVNLVNTFIVVHPLLSEADGENYAARLEQLAPRMDEALVEARRIAAKGVIPPQFILNRTIEQMRQFIGEPAANNPLVTTFAEKLALVAAIPPERREALRTRVERTVATQVYSAWERVIAFLQPLTRRVNDDAGLWRLNGGDEAYAYNLRRFTTTDLTANQIHELGLAQVTRLESEMDAILRQLGRTEGSVKARIE